MSERKYHFETCSCMFGQEQADPVTDSRAVPIYQTTSYVFHGPSTPLTASRPEGRGNIYGRLPTPPRMCSERRIAALWRAVLPLGR